eukprot:TRINITY_DN3689_c0_g2_i1.p1 TRINITY_DN3689_c0_g2~~TRINITY_DN3689_c0_g2_i1.p1  ORF type:complete len:411 (-),score=103.41 TRINITY_DN3689_c0_g2_i1:45-1277(-)
MALRRVLQHVKSISSVRHSIRSHSCQHSCNHDHHGQSLSISAAVCRGSELPLSIESLKLGKPRDGELLVRLVASGICHTDVAVKHKHIPSPFPIVLGHEGSGVVEAVGNGVQSVKVGDHVIMSYASCGGCRNCLSGKPSYCESHRLCNFGGKRIDQSVTHSTNDGQPIHGCFFRQSSFATHSIATERNVVVVDKDLPLHKLAPLGCGIQTGAGAVLNTLQVKPGSSIAVYGCGSVGMAAILAAALVHCKRVIAIDTNAPRLELARSLGATHTILAQPKNTQQNMYEELRALSGGGLDYALDTTGHPDVLKVAFESLRPLGVCALVGGSPPGSQVKLDMLHILLGRQLRGIIQGDAISKEFLPNLIHFYRQGRFPFDRLITFYDSLHDINSAIEDSVKGVVIKPVIRISDP